MTPSSFTRAYVAHDLGGDLHRLAQRAAAVAAALYVAGLAVGLVIHWANDWLSGDRRPWPVAWKVVAEPRPRLREIYSRLAMKTEVTMASPVASVPFNDPAALAKMASPAWIINESGGSGFVDLASMPLDELRALAMNQGHRYARPIQMASRDELIAALQ
jgi:hypothetical protein